MNLVVEAEAISNNLTSQGGSEPMGGLLTDHLESGASKTASAVNIGPARVQKRLKSRCSAIRITLPRAAIGIHRQ